MSSVTPAAGAGEAVVTGSDQPAELLADEFTVRAIAGLPDFRPGDDLVGAICAAADWITDGDILAVTSKAVSKVEGRLVRTGTDQNAREHSRRLAIDSQTAAVVAERRGVRIVRTHQGMTMAAAGVDASNVNADEIALLPQDADASARVIRAGVRERLGKNVAVVITDTVGRPWRAGLVDIAIGSAGIAPLRDLRGNVDTHGHPLAVTALAQVDQLASASELVRGKLGRVAAAVVRGVPWQPEDDDAPGAASALVRPGEEDMFNLGSRDVVPATQSARASEGAVDPALIEEALQRTACPDSVTVDLEGTRIVLRSGDQFALGMFVGQLSVALRAQGLATDMFRTPAQVELTIAPSTPYQGTP